MLKWTVLLSIESKSVHTKNELNAQLIVQWNQNITHRWFEMNRTSAESQVLRLASFQLFRFGTILNRQNAVSLLAVRLELNLIEWKSKEPDASVLFSVYSCCAVWPSTSWFDGLRVCRFIVFDFFLSKLGDAVVVTLQNSLATHFSFAIKIKQERRKTSTAIIR